MRASLLTAVALRGLLAATLGLGLSSPAQAQVANTTVITPPSGVIDSNPSNNTSTVTTPLASVVSSSKAAFPASGSTVIIGQQISYTLTTEVSSAPLTNALTLTDTLDPGLTFGAVTSSVGFTCTGSGSGPVNCVLPAGTPVGTYTVTYTATVNASATDPVANSVTTSEGACTDCSTQHPLAISESATSKTAAPASGSTVTIGQQLSYTLTTVVSNAPLASDLTLSDALDPGLTFGAVTSSAGFTCTGSGSGPVNCVLPAGTAVGTYTVTYTATVNPSATDSVSNAVTASQGSCTSCSTQHPLVVVSSSKTSDVGDGTAVQQGQEITYTITAQVSGAGALTAPLQLTDTLGTGLSFVAIVDAGAFTCTGGNPVRCTLPVGTTAGTYSASYRASVNEAATTSVSNSVVADQGSCTDCTTDNPLVGIATRKDNLAPGNNAPVLAGSVISYRITTVITGGALSRAYTATDTLGPGLTLQSVAAGSGFSCNGSNPLVCTLAAGTAPGTYTVDYTAVVDAGASGGVQNSVAASDGSCTDCSTFNPLAAVVTRKSSSVGNGTGVQAGDTITYTLTALITGPALPAPLQLTDTLSAGLTFGGITSPGAFSCNAANPVVCTLPAGTPAGSYSVSYTATVDASATGAVSNTVVPNEGDCVDCSTTNPVLTLVTSKSSDVGDGTAVQRGDLITYTLTTAITGGAPLSRPFTLTDTLGSGLEFESITSTGAYSCNTSSPIVCTLPAGTAAGTYTVSYTARVSASATTSVANSVVPSDGTCTDCTTDNPLVDIATSKSIDVGAGSPVYRGQTLTYIVTTVVTGGALTRPLTLTDTLGPGLALTAVTAPGSFSCGAGNPLACTLPAGTAAGSYPLTYTVNVETSASGAVNNSVVASDGSCSDCRIVNPLLDPVVGYSKTVTVPGGQTAAAVGDTLTYTITVSVGTAPTRAVSTYTDTLGPGLEFVGFTDTGTFSCSGTGPLVCTLPAGTAVGTYALSYTARVTPEAEGAVRNTVTATGEDNPGCNGPCSTGTTVLEPVVSYSKSVALPGGQTSAAAGDTLAYTITVMVSVAPTSGVSTYTDTLGPGLQFTGFTGTGAFTCSGTGPLVCTLPAGTPAGTYPLTYNALVTSTASGSVRNAVTATGEDDPTCTEPCSTDTNVLTPVVDVSKSATPASGTQVDPGQVLRYTLTAVVSGAPLSSPLVLTDTPGAGLTVSSLPPECNSSGTQIVCTLPVGTPVGVQSLSYEATVNSQAGSTVGNTVIAAGGGPDAPGCEECSTSHKVQNPLLRITKTAGSREVKIGDLVRYTLQIENLSDSDLVGGTIVDTTPAGFSFVSGSLQQSGGSALTVSGAGPVRLGNVSVPGGGTITVAYLMRVGAAVRPGTHVNQAQAQASSGTPISNVATAEVILADDPLLDESLIVGTVFDDRDGDGWQDRADLSRVRVQGGFAAADYVPGSTSMDLGDGPRMVADASAPLLKGMELGALRARSSEADPPEHTRLVVSQRLREARFTDDFVLTSAEGVTVRMDAQGNTRIERSGEAAKGLNAAEPVIERRVSTDAGGTRVDYVIRNEGIDERGIPGVRLATVEGLLVETDQFGRYHLIGIHGGEWERGRNFVIKLDPVTLPPGAVLTTDNPLLRRITPGLPVRFDFGVRMPPGTIGGGDQQVQAVLGRVLFAPGSDVISEDFLPAVDRMAETLRGRHGEVTISATGEAPELAFARATALKRELEQRLSAQDLATLSINVREGEDADAPLVAGLRQDGLVLGGLLFETGGATIRSQYTALLERVASELERDGGGRVSLHAGSDAEASRIGLERARVVRDALASKLSPEVLARVEVGVGAATRGPVQAGEKQP